MILNEITLKKAYNFLSKDKCLDYLIKRFSEEIDISERYDSNYSRALALLIIEQQVSFKAAITIKERFLKMINNLDNLEVLQIHSDDIQSIGISHRKVEYIKNVYEYFQKSNFNFHNPNNFEEKFEFILSPALAVPNQTFPALSSIKVVMLLPGIEV